MVYISLAHISPWTIYVIPDLKDYTRAKLWKPSLRKYYYKKVKKERRELFLMNLSLERRCSSRTFRYGYLVTT